MNKEDIARKAAELKSIAKRNGKIVINPAYDNNGKFDAENSTARYVEYYDREQLIASLENDPGIYFQLPYIYLNQPDILYATIQGLYSEREKCTDLKRVARINKAIEELNYKYENCAEKSNSGMKK